MQKKDEAVATVLRLPISFFSDSPPAQYCGTVLLCSSSQPRLSLGCHIWHFLGILRCVSNEVHFSFLIVFSFMCIQTADGTAKRFLHFQLFFSRYVYPIFKCTHAFARVLAFLFFFCLVVDLILPKIWRSLVVLKSPLKSTKFLEKSVVIQQYFSFYLLFSRIVCETISFQHLWRFSL